MYFLLCTFYTYVKCEGSKRNIKVVSNVYLGGSALFHFCFSFEFETRAIFRKKKTKTMFKRTKQFIAFIIQYKIE